MNMLTLLKLKESISKNIFNSKNESSVKLSLALLSSVMVMSLFYFTTGSDAESLIDNSESSTNLNVMIPDGYVLFGFEAENYEQVSPLLGPYNMVKVYSPLDGRILAQNIKVLRAPKAPDQLSFLVPVNIANYFARFGLEYRIVLQKYDGSKSPKLGRKDSKKHLTTLTYGGKKNEDN